MRTGMVICAASLAFAGLLASAEARAGRGFLGLRGSVTPRAAIVPPHGRTSPDVILGNSISHRAGAGPRYTALPGPEPVTRGIPVLAAEAPAPASASEAPVRKAVAASPWCPAERLVGSGKGFCLIN